MKRIYVYANSQHPWFILFNLLERSLFCHVHAFNSQHPYCIRLSPLLFSLSNNPRPKPPQSTTFCEKKNIICLSLFLKMKMKKRRFILFNLLERSLT
ncbi:hypothetical protein HanLR1_Chr03g0115161 [Helianthus annuus]|nr:hypothetical protein HanHA89_Chr03g0121941 [Helianthus annuus]KAJ0769657.1 hypothetical protein HanLR1_Chr03g0115161 [Helianthus annuus]